MSSPDTNTAQLMSRKPRTGWTSERKNLVNRGRRATAQNSGKTADGRFAKGNPHRFKPGRSGNPGGRAKNKLLSQAYRELLEQVDPKTGKTVAQLIAEKIIEKALKGDLAALKEITDRTEGKSVQPLSHGGLGSEPIAFHVNLGRQRGDL